MTTERATERRLAWLFNKIRGSSWGRLPQKWVLEAIKYGEAYGLQVARDVICPYCRTGVTLIGNCHPARRYCEATPIREELARLGVELVPELTEHQLSLVRVSVLTTIAFGNGPEALRDRDALVGSDLIYRNSTDTYRATNAGKRFVAQLQRDEAPEVSLEGGNLTARNIPRGCE